MSNRRLERTMVIDPGTYGTFKSTTLEDLLVEVLFMIREKEKEQPELTRLSLGIDLTQGRLDYQGSINVTSMVGIDGKPIINAVEYLALSEPS